MQRMEDWWTGKETAEKDGLDNMVWTEGQEAWRAGKVEKSKPGAENLRLMVERMF